MSDVDVDVLGDDELLERLKAMRSRVRDVSPALDAWGDLLADSTREAFDTEGASLGAPWDPLSPPYLAWKIATGLPEAILHRTLDLRESVTDRPFDHEVVLPRSAEFGTNVPYAAFHQTGTERMPQREFLVNTPSLQSELDRLIGVWVTDGVVA